MIQNLWILTVGNSDVQLIPDHDWEQWYSAIDSTVPYVHDLSFDPTEIKQVACRQDGEEDEEVITYRVPSRVLGMAYSDYSNPDEVFRHLCFPLLKNFIHQLKNKEKVAPDKVVILLTDQEQYFSKRHRTKDVCPYWQDTCKLKPILKAYIKEQLSIDLNDQEDWIILQPLSSDQGLDNWNAVLKLVEVELGSKLGNLNFARDATVYVSHQAGTPAISSAVQFVSLAKFGDRVKFLVSSEQDKTLTDTIESSAYLRGIKRGQAKELLAHHDYTGIKELLVKYLDPETQKLLDAAIQWNFAEFDEFKERLKEHPRFTAAVEERTKEENWWWMSYEAAYLGVVRLEQENTVEAMFHSFRALEGLVSKWSIIFYPDDISDRDGMPVAILKVPSRLPQFLLDEFEELRAEKPDKPHEIKLYGQKLFTLLQETKIQLKNNEDIKTLCQSARDKRNQLFHRLKGLDQERLFQAWGMNSRDSWEKRILSCLNLISEQNEFNSLRKASLMAQAHKELKRAIDKL